MEKLYEYLHSLLDDGEKIIKRTDKAIHDSFNFEVFFKPISYKIDGDKEIFNIFLWSKIFRDFNKTDYKDFNFKNFYNSGINEAKLPHDVSSKLELIVKMLGKVNIRSIIRFLSSSKVQVSVELIRLLSYIIKQYVDTGKFKFLDIDIIRYSEDKVIVQLKYKKSKIQILFEVENDEIDKINYDENTDSI